jgi:hypothetical protein
VQGDDFSSSSYSLGCASGALPFQTGYHYHFGSIVPACGCLCASKAGIKERWYRLDKLGIIRARSRARRLGLSNEHPAQKSTCNILSSACATTMAIFIHAYQCYARASSIRPDYQHRHHHPPISMSAHSQLKVSFSPPLYLQKRIWVLDVLRREQVTEVSQSHIIQQSVPSLVPFPDRRHRVWGGPAPHSPASLHPVSPIPTPAHRHLTDAPSNALEPDDLSHPQSKTHPPPPQTWDNRVTTVSTRRRAWCLTK